MLDFFKEKKIIIVIAIIGIVLLGFKFYNNKQDYGTIESSEILTQEQSEQKETEEIIVVHITGEVKSPGVVRVKEGNRIEDVINAAGGLTENADITNVNLAYVVEDGVKIRIPALDDEELAKQNYITDGAGENIIISSEEKNEDNKIVNINTASLAEIETLPGIGPSIATKIVEYREQNGKFKVIEDIKNVTGIGDSKFDKIKDYIKVK